MPLVSFPSYCNESDEVIPFANREAAQDWLRQQKLSNDGITLLVPFKDAHGKIKFLKPMNKQVVSNKNLRIIGMANPENERTRFQKFKSSFVSGKCRVPRIEDIKGDDIVPGDPHGFLIVYEKGEHEVGEIFYEIFNKLATELIDKIVRSSTNDPRLQINTGKLMECLSTLCLGNQGQKSIAFDIKSGRIFCSIDGRLFRYTFKKDPANTAEEAYLDAEKKGNMAKKVEVYTEKNINHYALAALRGYVKVFTLGIALGLAGGGLVFVFLSFLSVPFLAPIVAAVCSVTIAAFFIAKGVKQVAKANQDTTEYGNTTFKELSISIFDSIKNDIKAMFVCRKKGKVALVATAGAAVSEVVIPAVVRHVLSEDTRGAATDRTSVCSVLSNSPFLHTSSEFFKNQEESNAEVSPVSSARLTVRR